MHAIDGMACAKRGCDNRGKLGLNIVGHGSFPTKWGRRWRYRCTVCGGTVSTNTGTAYSGLRCARRECDQVASLRVEGVSISATARVTGHARHTIARWLERASTAAKRFNQRMLRDFEIIELQADELCTFIGNKSRATWLCAAIEVCSRLWAGSVLGRRSSRNAALLRKSKLAPSAPTRRFRHRSIANDSGRPSSVIRLSTLHARTDSTACAARVRLRSRSPRIDLYRKNAFSTRACR